MKRLLLLALWVLTADVLCRPAFAQQPCRPTVEGRLETFTLTSRVFHNTRTIRVWLPPAYDPARKYPVLYIPDGASAFDACTAFRGQELRADETLSELIAAGQVPPLIAVGIDNGSDVVDNSDNGVGRASEFLAYEDDGSAPFVPLGAAFPAFLATDVMPGVEARYPVQIGPEHSSIWGSSYGGAAILYTIVHRPGLFGSAIIESPSMQVGNGQLLRDTQLLVHGPSRIAIGVGTAEIGVPAAEAFDAAFVRAVRQLAEHCKGASATTCASVLTCACVSPWPIRGAA